MNFAFTATLTRLPPTARHLKRALCARTPARWHASTPANAAREAISSNKVMVFSTTTCPYCICVKSLFSDLQVGATVWDLDEMAEGHDIRTFLYEETGQTSVPNIFIGGMHIGGCDGSYSSYISISSHHVSNIATCSSSVCRHFCVTQRRQIDGHDKSVELSVPQQLLSKVSLEVKAFDKHKRHNNTCNTQRDNKC